MGVTGEAAPLPGAMLAMDVADTLRRDPELAQADDAVARLRALYETFGIAAPDEVLRDGIAAHREDRFAYAPPARGIGAVLARLYVLRRRWLPAAVAVGLMLAIGLGGYFLVYRPYLDSQIEEAQVDLASRMPAQMDALYQTIFEQTKVQQATAEAAELRDRGKDAARNGDRAGAQAAIDGLTTIRDTLEQDYTLRVVDRSNVKWGFWTFPENNTDATNYYLVVEARDPDGHALSLPVRDEQTGRTETVSIWGLRVPEEVYRAVEADKADDGIIQHTLVGAKDFGFLDPDYTVDVLGGAVTRW